MGYTYGKNAQPQITHQLMRDLETKNRENKRLRRLLEVAEKSRQQAYRHAQRTQARLTALTDTPESIGVTREQGLANRAALAAAISGIKH